MDEAAKALQTLLARIGAFFDIFDLSFFVSGAVSVGALWLGYKLRGGQLLSTVPDGYLLTGILLGCYVLGLLCFALGRALRQAVVRLFRGAGSSQRLREALAAAVKAHDLGTAPLSPKVAKTIGQYLQSRDGKGREAGTQWLYTLLWTKLRQTPHLAPSLMLLNRYWVMTATNDGLGAAALLWSGMLLCYWRGWGLPMAGSVLAGVGAVVGVLLALLFLREAQRYVLVQIDELCATVAWDLIERPELPSTTPGVNIQVTTPGSGSASQ